MGCFHVDVRFFHLADRSRSAVVPQMLVDTGSEATWVPRAVLEQLGVRPEVKDRSFQMANGQIITRTIGYAVLEVAPDFKTVDEVVFAEPGDLALLGARSLEGLNVRVDPQHKQLVAAGPIPAAGNLKIRTKSDAE
ncbi:MAG TPA: retroviral-like aspartic protease family protein [Tepidisphaeraceae bacterium]|nr:retroviral-like aspartic protease family protein [Tepidisphaeraceae bacterium]